MLCAQGTDLSRAATCQRASFARYGWRAWHCRRFCNVIIPAKSRSRVQEHFGEGCKGEPKSQDALDRIALTTDLIREKQTKTSLTVQVYVTVAVRWLIPRLQTFKQASPEFLVEADLRSGSLVIPMHTEVMQAGGWYLAHVQRRGEEQPIRRFLHWIQSQ